MGSALPSGPLLVTTRTGAPDQRDQSVEVLNFWFGETQPRQWVAKDPSFDDLVQQRFLTLTRRAIAGELDAWDADPTGALALAADALGRAGGATGGAAAV